MSEIDANIIDAVARVVTVGNPRTITGSFIGNGLVQPHVVAPTGYEVTYLKHAEETPLLSYISQTPKFLDAASFSSYVKQFATPASRIFLDTEGTFRGVIDYHATPTPGTDRTDRTDTRANRLAHTALFSLESSPEWKRWAGLHDKWLTQEQAIELLEEQRADVVNPPAVDIIAIASDLKAVESSEFVAKQTRSASGVAVVLTAKVEGQHNGVSVSPPEELVLSIPVFRHGKAVTVSVALNWRGKPQQFVKVRLLEVERLRDEAVAYERELVASASGIPVFLGRP